MTNLIIKYKRESCYNVSTELARYLELDSMQEDIEDFLSQYIILGDREIKSSTILIRLSHPFFWIAQLIIILTWLPIRWLLTGEFGYKKDTRFSLFITKWAKKYE